MVAEILERKWISRKALAERLTDIGSVALLAMLLSRLPADRTLPCLEAADRTDLFDRTDLRSIMSDDDPVDLIKVCLAEWTLPFRSAGSRRSSRSGSNRSPGARRSPPRICSLASSHPASPAVLLDFSRDESHKDRFYRDRT